jgi:aminotransferase EvaB
VIPVFDYVRQYAAIEAEVLAAVRGVLAAGKLILGPQCTAFEQAFATTLGGGHAVGVGNGTDALTICLRALGVGSGAEVVTVANTAVPTVSAIRAAGATPVFCDVDPRTCLMDLGKLPACLTAKTRAVVPVHLFGNAVDVERLRQTIGARDVKVIEDCAQAHGTGLSGRPVGTFGEAAAFSFYPTKNLGAYGDGGLCFSRDERLAATMRSIRMYGFEGHYYSEREGINSRLDELQAAILNVKLPRLNAGVARRRAIAARYDAALSPRIERVAVGAGAEHAYHLYVVKVVDRDRVRQRLAELGIGTGIHYPFPIHRMRGYAFLGYAAGSLPATEALAERVLSLPMFPELTDGEVDEACRALNQVAG